MCMQDKQGNLALHLAARHGTAGLLPLLLEGLPGLLRTANNEGQLPLHVAARSGAADAASALLRLDPGTASLLRAGTRSAAASPNACRLPHAVLMICRVLNNSSKL